MKLPERLYIQVSDENTKDEWFSAQRELEDMDDGKVGIYILQEMKTKSTKHILS